MIQISDIHDLLAQGENERLEFKVGLRESGELAKLIGAFANSDGGTIVIGVREPAEVIGTDVKRIRQLYERAIEKLEPKPHTSFASIDVSGKEIVVIEVDKANSLVFAENGAYARVGAATQPMTAHNVTQALMLAQARQPDQFLHGSTSYRVSMPACWWSSTWQWKIHSPGASGTMSAVSIEAGNIENTSVRAWW